MSITSRLLKELDTNINLIQSKLFGREEIMYHCLDDVMYLDSVITDDNLDSFLKEGTSGDAEIVWSSNFVLFPYDYYYSLHKYGQHKLFLPFHFKAELHKQSDRVKILDLYKRKEDFKNNVLVCLYFSKDKQIVYAGAYKINSEGTFFVLGEHKEYNYLFDEVYSLYKICNSIQNKAKTKSYVYFADAGDKVKIGYSTDPYQRIDSLRTGNPDVDLLGYMEGDYKLEKQLHKKFSHLNIDREWFRLTPELKSYISKLKLIFRRKD